MSVISLKARVSLISEEQIDAKLLGEPVEITPYVCWRKITLRSAEILHIGQYDKEKCVVYTYDGEQILVKEPHSLLHKRWSETVGKENPEEKEEYKEEVKQDDVDDEDENEN